MTCEYPEISTLFATYPLFFHKYINISKKHKNLSKERIAIAIPSILGVLVCLNVIIVEKFLNILRRKKNYLPDL